MLLVAALTWLIAVPVNAFSGAAKVASAPSGARPAQQPGTLYLMVGSDSREGMTAAEKKKLGTGTVAGGRTDTIILLYVPLTGKPVMISVPRDSYVAIPGHGKNKINASYAIGGAALLIQTIEQATGLRVDHYVEIGFEGFAGLVDAVGGVDVCLSKPMNDAKAHINLPKGCQTLDGAKALGYVRARYSDPLGDLGRVQRQREIVSKIISKAATPATILNPVRYWKLTHAAADAIALGDDTGLLSMPRFALAMRAISRSDGYTLTVPVATASLQTPNAGIAVQWDETKAKALFADLARGDTSDVAKYVTK